MIPTVYLWADFVCPYCYVAEIEFERACEELKLDIPVRLMSYELEPDLDPQSKESLFEHRAALEGVEVSEIERQMQDAVDFAKAHDVEIHLDKAPASNTHDAHRLKELAKKTNQDLEFFRRAQQAYFEEGKNLADHDVLREIALEVGLDKDDVDRILSSKHYDIAVKDQYAAGVTKQIEYVPHFVFPTGKIKEGVLDKEALLPVLKHEYAFYGNTLDV